MHFYIVLQILNLCQGHSLGLWNTELHEEDTHEGEQSKYPEGVIHADGISDGAKVFGDEKAEKPTESRGNWWPNEFDLRRQNLSDDNPA